MTLYLSNRSKFNRSIWCQEGLQLLASTADTLPQRVALTKLYLGQYQADLQFELGTRPICSCGCRNILTDWLSVCQREDVLQLNKDFLPILSVLNIPRTMALVLYAMLTGTNNVCLFRGNWSLENRQSIEAAFQRTHDATIRTWRRSMLMITTCLTSHSLDLYHLVNSTPTPPVSPQPQSTPTALEIFVNYTSSTSSSQPNLVAPTAVSHEVYSTPFLCDIRPNPSSAPPKNKLKSTVLTSTQSAPPTRKRRGRLSQSHSITEYFIPIVRAHVPTEDEALTARSKSPRPTFCMDTEVVLLKPRLHPDIRKHFQAVGQVSNVVIATDPHPLPHDPGPPDAPARTGRHGIMRWLTSSATYPT